ncbi:TonB-dependent siderophore receptor [Caulobacter sp. FWC2]|uniref:TonB-dependent siderophore receptor n=1 Tax=Caulobacter sp. FWC2 TaxID=69664 RepID=UPI000C156E90|nr:TonB-dependent receptor [Caulobacter sp. FWC2]PIB91594.1 hypothetical protein CSW62_08420 [Caulobacter sp. FWC2]
MKKTRGNAGLLAALMAGCAGAAFVAPAWAQTVKTQIPASQADDSKSSPESSLVSDIVVTGYRVDATTSATGLVTAIVDTPMSISAVTDKFLRDTGSTQLMDAIGSLTGVTGQSNSGETPTNFSVRGYAVAPQIDGFSTLSITGGLGSSVAVERIEVLKGPSAVFNGNVPPGGTINIIYKRPSFKSESYVELTGGSWNYKSAELFSTGALVPDKVAYLIDGYVKDSDGWVDWTKHDERTIVGALRVEPIKSLRFDVGVRKTSHEMQISTLPVSHEGYIGSGSPWGVPLDAWVAQNYGPLEPPQTITVPQYVPNGRRGNVLGPQNFNKSDLTVFEGGVHFSPNDAIELRDVFISQKYNWDGLTILQSGAKVIGADRKSSVISGLLAGDIAGSGWENKLEAALHFDTGPINHETLIGYQLAHSQSDHYRVWVGGPALNSSGQPWDYFVDGPRLLGKEFAALTAANPNPVINLSKTSKVRTHAFYVAEQASAFDGRVRVVVGGRYSKTSTDKLGVHAFTPQAAILIKPFDPTSRLAETSFFLNYSKSFTPSGLVEPNTGDVVPPARGIGKEIGVKTSWFGGRLASTVSYFQDELHDIATPDYSQQGQTGMAVFHLGGAGRVEGVEGDIVWTPSSALQISANYTYLPTAKYTSYPNVPQQEGLRFPSTPKRAFNLSARYALPEGALKGTYVGGWLHTQSSTRGVLNSDWQYNVVIPTQTDVDAFLGYQFGNCDLRLNVKNLLNRDGYVAGNAFQPASPRSAFLTLRIAR